MTASTNTIVIRRDGWDGVEEYSGVMYAEEAYHAGHEVEGVAIQYAQQPHEDGPMTEFVAHAELVGVYDDVCEQSATETYQDWVTNK